MSEVEKELQTLFDHLTSTLVDVYWHLKAYTRKGLGETKLGNRAGTRALIWVDSRHWGKVGAETEGKIKTGAGAGELRPPASGCYYTSIMRKGEEGGLSLHLSTP